MSSSRQEGHSGRGASGARRASLGSRGFTISSVAGVLRAADQARTHSETFLKSSRSSLVGEQAGRREAHHDALNSKLRVRTSL